MLSHDGHQKVTVVLFWKHMSIHFCRIIHIQLIVIALKSKKYAYTP
jgi:hypothetical protein